MTKMKVPDAIARGGMVACENQMCETKWFHLVCLEMSKAPSKKWMCPTCHPALKLKVKRTVKWSNEQEFCSKIAYTVYIMKFNSFK